MDFDNNTEFHTENEAVKEFNRIVEHYKNEGCKVEYDDLFLINIYEPDKKWKYKYFIDKDVIIIH